MEKTQIEFANQSQEVQKDLSLKEITKIFFQNWPLFLLLFSFFVITGMLYYKFNNPFISKTSIVINDVQNSQLQLFAQGVISTSVKMNEAKKPNSMINKRLDLLGTADFYNQILNEIINVKQENLSLNEYVGLKNIRSDILKGKISFTDDEKIHIYRVLENMISFKVKTDFEIEIAVSSDTKETSLVVSNIVARKVMQILKDKESEEISSIFNFLVAEKNKVDTELAEINKKISSFADKPENLVSISSKDKVADYMAELMMRKSETVLKISENNKIMQSLKSYTSNGRKENQLYGNNGKLQALTLENEILKSKLNQIQSAIDSMANKAKNMPYLAQVYDDLKKSSDLNMQKLKDISDSLTKLEAVKLAANHKYEIYEPARFDKVAPQVSLSIILFLCLLFSQVLGSLIIYLRAIWDTNIITAQATRNIVVVNSHSLDPRVIIENSKIKFRLRNSNIDLDDPESGKSKKIGFNFYESSSTASREESKKTNEDVDREISSGNV